MSTVGSLDVSFYMEFILISNYHIIINSSFDLSTETRSQMPKLHLMNVKVPIFSFLSVFTLSTTDQQVFIQRLHKAP